MFDQVVGGGSTELDAARAQVARLENELLIKRHMDQASADKAAAAIEAQTTVANLMQVRLFVFYHLHQTSH
jgi:hypothetical protein